MVSRKLVEHHSFQRDNKCCLRAFLSTERGNLFPGLQRDNLWQNIDDKYRTFSEKSGNVLSVIVFCGDVRYNNVIRKVKMIYGIETNFYGGGESKLNETARSYKMLSQEVLSA